MKMWSTKFHAIKPGTNDLVQWQGPIIEELTKGMAQQWCNEHAGHLIVDGEVTSIIECFPGTNIPDRSRVIDYDIENN